MSDDISKSVQEKLKRSQEMGRKLKEIGHKYYGSNENFVKPNSSNYIPESNQSLI